MEPLIILVIGIITGLAFATGLGYFLTWLFTSDFDKLMKYLKPKYKEVI